MVVLLFFIMVYPVRLSELLAPYVSNFDFNSANQFLQWTLFGVVFTGLLPQIKSFNGSLMLINTLDLHSRRGVLLLNTNRITKTHDPILFIPRSSRGRTRMKIGHYQMKVCFVVEFSAIFGHTHPAISNLLNQMLVTR